MEVNATCDYKNVIMATEAADIVYADFFSGIPGNDLRQSIESCGYDAVNPLRRETGVHVTQGIKARRDIWAAGQGAGAIGAVESVERIITRWRADWA